jgi:hypothetical protein
MDETKELSTLIKGGIPTNPKEAVAFINKLQVGIDLAQTALKQKGIDPKKYKEILANGQEWAVLKLQAELRLKDFIESIPKNSGGDRSKKAPRVPFAPKKNKMNVVEELLGLTPKQQKAIHKLSPFGIKAAIEQSKKEGDIPTRYNAIKWAKIEKDRSNLKSSLKPLDKTPKPAKSQQYTMLINIKTNTSSINKKLYFDDKEDFDDFYDGLIQRFEGYINYHTFKKSPFNYTGSKARLIPYIYPHIKNHERIVSPFLGGGSIEIYLSNCGHSIMAYDYSPDISNMWEQIQNKSELLKCTAHAELAVFQASK